MNTEDFYSQLAIDVAAVPDEGSLTDQQVADAINARTIAGTRTIPSISLLVWVTGRGKLAGIKAASEASEHPAHGLAIAMMAITQRSDALFDKDDTDHAAMLDGLVSASLLSSADKTDLLAMTVTSTPYVYATYGVKEITEHDIAHVRSM